MRLLAAATLLLALPAASASGPHIEVAVSQEDDLVLLGDALPFTFEYTFTCGEPADPETHIDVEGPSSPGPGNYFNLTFERMHWVHTSADCAQASGTIRQTTKGAFRYTIALPPFHTQTFDLSAWVGNGDAIWTEDRAPFRATPDAHLLIGAQATPPVSATRSGESLVVPVTWTVSNHGKGAFQAAVSVDSKPDWMQVEVPPSVASSAGPSDARAAFTMLVTMPASCPARSGVVTLAFDVSSPEPRSRAHAEPKVQAVVPCDPSLASQGTPAVGPALLLLLPALALVGRRRAKQQHKR